MMRVPFRTALSRAAGLPRSAWGTAVAHFGIAVTLLGVIAAGTWGTERIVAGKPGQTIALSHYELTFDGMKQQPGPNYSAVVATFTVRRAGTVIGVKQPSKRTFATRSMSTNEAALMARGFGQLYLSHGER